MTENKKASVACHHCQNPMELANRKKFPGHWAAVLVVTGVFLCLFFTGAVIGIPMLLLGIYMATARETISHCPSCGHYFKVWVSEKVSG